MYAQESTLMVAQSKMPFLLKHLIHTIVFERACLSYILLFSKVYYYYRTFTYINCFNLSATIILCGIVQLSHTLEHIQFPIAALHIYIAIENMLIQKIGLIVCALICLIITITFIRLAS